MKSILSQLNDELQAVSRSIRERAMEAVKEYLAAAPGQTLSLLGRPGYAMVLNHADEWVETAIHGVRINGGCLEITTTAGMSVEEDKDTPYWGEDSVYTDGDHYCTINWLSILDSIAGMDKDVTENLDSAA